MPQEPRPNFFIVGAPKCGTTAMHTYLAQHPQVFMSPIKEPHFFGSDLEWVETPRIDRDRYLGLFADATPAQVVVGESSVFYLRSQRAAGEIAAFNPDARILIMLRDPTEMIHSFHSQRVYNGTEDRADFRAALAAETSREKGELLPPVVGFRQGLYYRQMGLYAEQCQRFFQAFPREQVLIELYDDFREDTAASFRRVCRFLDIDPRFEPDFQRINANTVNRFPALRQLLLRRPGWLVRLGRILAPNRQIRSTVVRKVRAMNTIRTEREPLDSETRRALHEYFAADLARLREMLNRDLSGWN